MRHVVRKIFFNSEKEEKWLNEMAAKGISLVEYSLCRYVFEDTANGEHIYRIILFDHPITHPETSRCIQFIEETGAEVVASHLNWVYFRKKVSETDCEFEIYTDMDSKITHYKRLQDMFLVFAIVQIFPICLNLGILLDGNGHRVFTPMLMAVSLVFGLIMLRISRRYKWRKGKLEIEKTIKDY